MCELREEGQKAPQCCLCPIAGGALKPTGPLPRAPGAAASGSDPSPPATTWCHAACMQWIPEVTTSDFARMEPIIGIETIQKERWELSCCVCRQRMGAKIQVAYGKDVALSFCPFRPFLSSRSPWQQSRSRSMGCGALEGLITQ